MACSDNKYLPTLYMFLGWFLTVLGYIMVKFLIRAIGCLHRYRDSLSNPDSSEKSDQASRSGHTRSPPYTNEISTITTQFGHSKSDMDRDIGYSTYV